MADKKCQNISGFLDYSFFTKTNYFIAKLQKNVQNLKDCYGAEFSPGKSEVGDTEIYLINFLIFGSQSLNLVLLDSVG